MDQYIKTITLAHDFDCYLFLLNKSLDATDQFAVFLHIKMQNGHHEAEDAFHVLGEGLLDVSASLGGQRLERDHILRQSQQDQHHQLCLSLL